MLGGRQPHLELPLIPSRCAPCMWPDILLSPSAVDIPLEAASTELHICAVAEENCLAHQNHCAAGDVFPANASGVAGDSAQSQFTVPGSRACDCRWDGGVTEPVINSWVCLAKSVGRSRFVPETTAALLRGRISRLLLDRQLSRSPSGRKGTMWSRPRLRGLRHQFPSTPRHAILEMAMMSTRCSSRFLPWSSQSCRQAGVARVWPVPHYESAVPWQCGRACARLLALGRS